MTEAIIVACITAAASIICQVIIGRNTRTKTVSQNTESINMINYRLDKLDAKVTKHNNYIERLTIAEQSLKSAWHQIDEIKDELRNK